MITALTAQNTLEVTATESVSESMFHSQLQALSVDLPPAVIKTGMLGSAAICRILADFLATPKLAECPIVCDPILHSTSGTELLDPAALDLLKNRIFPFVTVLTPNLPEAEQLLGKRMKVRDAAMRLLETGVQSVLIKGGHDEGGECRDYWTDGTQAMWLSSPRIESPATHGTGCILSSSIAAGIALGKTLPEAVIDAKTFLNQCLDAPAYLGRGRGPMQIEPFLNRSKDRPRVIPEAIGYR